MFEFVCLVARLCFSLYYFLLACVFLHGKYAATLVIYQLIRLPIDVFAAKCLTCGKIMRKTSLRRHVFDVHFPKQQLPCDICHKLFKTANSLTTHLITIHRQFKTNRYRNRQTWTRRLCFCFLITSGSDGVPSVFCCVFELRLCSYLSVHIY